MKLSRLMLLAFLSTGFSSTVFAQSPNPLEPTKELYIQAIESETTRIAPLLEKQVHIQVLRTDNPNYRMFVAQGLMQVNNEAYIRLENGLASVANMNPGQHPNCFVLLNPDRNGARTSIFKDMLEATKDPNQSAAFLVGHEVGHCLSFLERNIATHKKSQWSVDDAVAAGIQKDAFERTFGKKLATGAYFNRSHELYSDLAQRQYDERVADAFAALWYIRLGGNPEGLKAAEAIRRRDNPKNAHYTAPVFDRLPLYQEKLANTNDIMGIWNLARAIQKEVGVETILGPGSTEYKAPIMQEIKKIKEENKVPVKIVPPRSLKWNEIPRLGS